MTEGAVIGLIQRDAAEWRLTLYSRQSGQPIAVVSGSDTYIERALRATGLAALVPTLAKNGDRTGVALVSGKPTDRRTERTR